MDPELQQAWLLEWAETWDLPDLPGSVRVRFSPRIRRSLGRCDPRTGSVNLHPGLADGPTGLLREVLCHEAAHVAVRRLHPRRARPHGPEWARLMRLAGYDPRACYDPHALPPEMQQATRPRMLYRHRCTDCGTSRLAGRSMRRWRCRTCHDAGLAGRLEITPLRTTEVQSAAPPPGKGGDMAWTRATVTIDAPVDRVFDTVSNINNFAKAIDPIVKVEFLTDRQSGIGTRFRETRRMRGKEATTTLEVTEYVKDDRIRLVADEHGTVWDSVFTVKPVAGKTELTLEMEARPHTLLARIVTPMVRGMVRKALQDDMEAVKGYCEG